MKWKVTNGSLAVFWPGHPSDNLDITFKAEVGEYDTKGRNMVALVTRSQWNDPVLNDFRSGQ